MMTKIFVAINMYVATGLLLKGLKALGQNEFRNKHYYSGMFYN